MVGSTSVGWGCVSFAVLTPLYCCLFLSFLIRNEYPSSPATFLEYVELLCVSALATCSLNRLTSTLETLVVIGCSSSGVR